MTIDWHHDAPQHGLPDGFLYVGQDNYWLGSPDCGNERYLYSDSATSCSILILEGYQRDGGAFVAFAHLSCAERFSAFFRLVEQHFCGPLSVFALGANPPDAEASKATSRLLLHWLQAHAPSPYAPPSPAHSWYVEQATLAIGFRVPEIERSGCAGIDLATGVVSTQAYALTAAQRDPTGGVQTLFSLFGLALEPPLVLHDATEEFGEAECVRLAAVAYAAGWPRIAGLSDEQILAMFSSTPDDEPPWFCDHLRLSADSMRKYEKRRVS